MHTRIAKKTGFEQANSGLCIRYTTPPLLPPILIHCKSGSACVAGVERVEPVHFATRVCYTSLTYHDIRNPCVFVTDFITV